MKPVKDPAYFEVLKQIQRETLKGVGTNFTGQSPPEIFVGEWNYPNVFTGMLAPVGEQEGVLLSSPEAWYKNEFTVKDILYQRGGMVYSRFIQPVKKQEGKLKEIMQEVSMAKKETDINFDLKKKPTVNIKVDGIHHPIFNPAPLNFAKLETNPGVPRRIDYVVSDHHLKASEGITDLYKHDFDITKINRILSAGLLGVKTQRRLVPTKWSITATDDIISKTLLEKIRTNPWINDVELYHGEYLGNHYEIILMPRQWSFEVIEAKWNQDPNRISFWQDYENHYKRKTYASDVVGGYYATRIGIAEQLSKRGRQASALLLRQVKGYEAPCGVGVLRELVRDIMTKKPEMFQSLQKALEKAQTRIQIPVSMYLQKSQLFKELRTQKTLGDYR